MAKLYTAPNANPVINASVLQSLWKTSYQKEGKEELSEKIVKSVFPGSILFISIEPFSLYSKYINNRQHSCDMNPSSIAQYRDFLEKGKQGTSFHLYREADASLAVSVTDSSKDCVSAINNFYDPKLSSRALGILMILSLIGEIRKQNKRFPYIRC